ncbi:MAG: class I SAM-dependent methyltransferase [Methylotenera sp.]|nr:class I SAM-dependent methyltransferase [Methylotenera sp.]
MTQTISWTEANKEKSSVWHSENNAPVPKRVQIADDTIKADAAYKLCCEGTALLWRGDFQNAKLFMQALSRRIDRPHKRPKKAPANMTEAFHLHRQAQSQKARILGMLVIEVGVGYNINLRRAPDVKAACEHAYGKSTHSFVVSLREILGLVGAYEWSKNGVDISVINNKIFPSYGVFSPIRGEYLDLVDVAPLPKPCNLAFDIGTGTGVLAAILANRGVTNVIATDNSHRALDCALKNITKLDMKNAVKIVEADLFPNSEYGKADLIVCNPPWLPAHPSSALESAVYDDKSKMLKGFIHGLAAHLNNDGEGWLVLSDFAEHLGLRTREELLGWITASGLNVIERLDTKAKHSKTLDVSDPLHTARKAEVTSLWRLSKQ